MDTPVQTITHDNVIFFDGYCGLCNGFVDFVMKIDKKHKFRFSPLQSEYAKRNLPPQLTTELKSVVVQSKGKTLQKTEAVMMVAKQLGGVWALGQLLTLLPKPLLDQAYDMVAENRYKIFGKRDSCRLPTPEERALFIM